MGSQIFVNKAGEPVDRYSLVVQGHSEVWVGRGDDITAGTIGAGDFFKIDSTANTSVEYQLLEHHYIKAGRLYWDGGSVDDSIDFCVYAPTTPTTPNPGAGEYDVQSGKIIHNGTNTGAYDINLTETLNANTTIHKATPVPNRTRTGNFDYNPFIEDGKDGHDMIVKNLNGTGTIDLYIVDVPLAQYAVGLPIMGSGNDRFIGDEIEMIFKHWRHKLVLNNVSANQIKLRGVLDLQRKNTV